MTDQQQGRARVSGLEDQSADGPHRPVPAADLEAALGNLADETTKALRLPQLMDWLNGQLERFTLRSW